MSRRECFVHQAAGAADPIVPLIDVLEGIQEIEDRTLWIHGERLRKSGQYGGGLTAGRAVLRLK
jgi:hypothetical protein